MADKDVAKQDMESGGKVHSSANDKAIAKVDDNGSIDRLSNRGNKLPLEVLRALYRRIWDPVHDGWLPVELQFKEIEDRFFRLGGKQREDGKRMTAEEVRDQVFLLQWVGIVGKVLQPIANIEDAYDRSEVRVILTNHHLRVESELMMYMIEEEKKYSRLLAELAEKLLSESIGAIVGDEYVDRPILYGEVSTTSPERLPLTLEESDVLQALLHEHMCQQEMYLESLREARTHGVGILEESHRLLGQLKRCKKRRYDPAVIVSSPEAQ